ncbi:MAG: response regulator receiver protein [Hyphomicrobiales bacterium]|nr:response regulator receiver protein [Hyphomicrobiales bacterium]
MSLRVLIVDDSKLARIVLTRTIGALQPDWSCVEAANGDEALATIGQHHADVVILDFNMPGKNGLEVAEELRSRFPDMPIAIATANIQDEIISRARAAQAHFIAKPVNEDGLRGFLVAARKQLLPESQ